MKFKQRVCGFLGHRSVLMIGYRPSGYASNVAFACQRCGFISKWFHVDTFKNPSENK